ncbi:hypothetical protein FOL46_001238 [Perkinsus olseni]|uniref:Uncharacterized protein n=1 Tax=Perkinsus olseni TaxID=32597 RepID=A0A7J6MEC2_PEROL|nr:hypothetical protein FOL46_001238 [Perkinsus olseni]
MDLNASQRFQPIAAQLQAPGYPTGLVTSQSLSATQYNGVRAPSFVPDANVDRMESSVYSEATREDVGPTDILPPQTLMSYLDCTVRRLYSMISYMQNQELKDALTRWAELPTLDRTTKEVHRTREQVLNQRWAIKAGQAENDVLALEEIDKEYAAKIADCDGNWLVRHEDLREQLRAVTLEGGLAQGLVLMKVAINRATSRLLQSALWKWKDLVNFQPGEVFGDSARLVSGLFPEPATAVGHQLTAIAAFTHDHADLNLIINRARTASYQQRKLEVESCHIVPAARAMSTVLRKLLLSSMGLASRTYDRALQDFMDFAELTSIGISTHCNSEGSVASPCICPYDGTLDGYRSPEIEVASFQLEP